HLQRWLPGAGLGPVAAVSPGHTKPPISVRPVGGCVSQGSDAERLLHLGKARVRHHDLSATIGGNYLNGRHRLVAPVRLLDERGRVRVLLDVDLGVRDALAIHLALQPTAVAAPRGAVHRHSARHVVSLSFGGSGKSSSRERTPPRRHSRRAGPHRRREVISAAPARDACARPAPSTCGVHTTARVRLWTTGSPVAGDLAAWRCDSSNALPPLPAGTGLGR